MVEVLAHTTSIERSPGYRGIDLDILGGRLNSSQFGGHGLLYLRFNIGILEELGDAPGGRYEARVAGSVGGPVDSTPVVIWANWSRSDILIDRGARDWNDLSGMHLP
jgi:hypothetical protein